MLRAVVLLDVPNRCKKIAEKLPIDEDPNNRTNKTRDNSRDNMNSKSQGPNDSIH
jgi:hypothetical protein